MSRLTIRIDERLARDLGEFASRWRCSRSEAARRLLRQRIALARFRELRRQAVPVAAALGYLSDEDVFRDLS